MHAGDRIGRGRTVDAGNNSNTAHAKHHVVFKQPDVHLVVFRIVDTRPADKDGVTAGVAHDIVGDPCAVHLCPNGSAVAADDFAVAKDHLTRAVGLRTGPAIVVGVITGVFEAVVFEPRIIALLVDTAGRGTAQASLRAQETAIEKTGVVRRAGDKDTATGFGGDVMGEKAVGGVMRKLEDLPAPVGDRRRNKVVAVVQLGHQVGIGRRVEGKVKDGIALLCLRPGLGHIVAYDILHPRLVFGIHEGALIHPCRFVEIGINIGVDRHSEAAVDFIEIADDAAELGERVGMIVDHDVVDLHIRLTGQTHESAFGQLVGLGTLQDQRTALPVNDEITFIRVVEQVVISRILHQIKSVV